MKISKLRIVNYKSFADSGEISLGSINVLTGRNNSGKSAFIHAAHLIQTGADYNLRDIRRGADFCEVSYSLEDLQPALLARVGAIEVGTPVPAIVQIQERVAPTNLATSIGDARTNYQLIQNREPENFIYTYFSKRKVTAFDQVVNQEKTVTVSNNLQYLVAKVDRLANQDYPKSQEYSELCRSILGFRVSAVASPNGHQAGILVGPADYIPIEDMGEGVSSLLGLITDLCVADGNLFLIEELENDIHPEGLKTILQVILEKSSSNQFIISTHSNIVLRYLGSAPGSRVFNTELEYQPGSVPTSTIREVDATPQARMRVLQRLGYELYDFDLWEGWLFLEESSAEVIIRNYLIPWFTPRLSRIRTISAGGTSKIEPLFEDFHRLFLFTHLQPQYYGRAWVIADGDASGREVMQRLADKYSGWPPGHFRNWTESDFERYYPNRFSAIVDDALSKNGQEKRSAKQRVLSDVKQFCNEQEDDAKEEFETSALEVITTLQEIERNLFGGAAAS
jgi:hypothetical protein